MYTRQKTFRCFLSKPTAHTKSWGQPTKWYLLVAGDAGWFFYYGALFTWARVQGGQWNILLPIIL